MIIYRLNSGIFRIFELRDWNLNLNNWDCRASKIIWNDTNAEQISWEINIENSIFIFCVGVWVGGYPRKTHSYRWQTREFYIFCRAWNSHCKTARKFDFPGLKLRGFIGFTQGIGQKFWYLQEQYDSLNQFQFLEIKIPLKKVFPEFNIFLYNIFYFLNHYLRR